MKKIVYLLLVLFLSACKNEQKTDSKPNSEAISASKVNDISLASGQLIRVDSFPSKYVTNRNLDVWLPNDYSKAKKYAVLYMHDGQMLFDSTKTWNKQEWKVDEWASQLMKEGKTQDFIVVAPWNISEIRHNDYFPKQPVTDNLQEINAYFNAIDFDFDTDKIYSDDYLKFLVEELKPYIDETYSTKTDTEHTFVMGSSMGGLISMYAICEYPEVFGGAACLSTHWIGAFSNENNRIPYMFLDYMKQKLPDSKKHKIYFDYGTKTLDSLYLPYQDSISRFLKTRGIQNLKFEGAGHSEISWSERLNVPMEFLLGK